MLGHARGCLGSLKALSSRKYRICGSAVANDCCLLVEGSDALCSWDPNLVMSVDLLIKNVPHLAPKDTLTDSCQIK
jgi:hypothetical protein